MLQPLESRRLLAVSIAFSPQDGVLRITGSEQADVIHLAWLSHRRVGVTDGKTVLHIVDPDRLRYLSFAGQGGDDLFTLGRVDVRSCLNGGEGDDSLSGAGRCDWMLGGDGDDYCFGKSQYDHLEDGTGRNTLLGGAGDDILIAQDGDAPGGLISGGAGNDKLEFFGNAGVVLHMGQAVQDPQVVTHTVRGDIETVMGNDGNDYIANYAPHAVRLDGWGGNDTLIGGPGDDSLGGGDGQDQLFGNDGDDDLYGGDEYAEPDTLEGGSGTNNGLIGQRDSYHDLATFDPPSF